MKFSENNILTRLFLPSFNAEGISNNKLNDIRCDVNNILNYSAVKTFFHFVKLGEDISENTFTRYKQYLYSKSLKRIDITMFCELLRMNTDNLDYFIKQIEKKLEKFVKQTFGVYQNYWLRPYSSNELETLRPITRSYSKSTDNMEKKETIEEKMKRLTNDLPVFILIIIKEEGDSNSEKYFTVYIIIYYIVN